MVFDTDSNKLNDRLGFLSGKEEEILQLSHKKTARSLLPILSAFWTSAVTQPQSALGDLGWAIAT
jgi:hypothetical protein